MWWRRVMRWVGLVSLLAAIGWGAWRERERWLGVETSRLAPAAASPAAAVEITSVKLSEEAVRGLGLRSEEARLATYQKVIEIPGVMVDVPGRARAVSVPMAGIVAQIHVVPGEAVRPGDPLFTILLTSELVQTIQTELARSAKDLIAATARRDQIKRLVDIGTKAAFELLDEENTIRRLTTQREGFRRQLKLFGFSDDQVKQAEAGDFITEIVVRAPTAQPAVGGTESTSYPFEVESIAVTQGQGVITGQLLARLADYREVLIQGQAFETEADLVTDATGDGRAIGVDFQDHHHHHGVGLEETQLVIRSVGKTDAATRTFPFYVGLVNDVKPYERDGKMYLAWRYRPGRHVRLRIPTGTIPQVFVLPADAVVREGADAYVFRQNGEAFERRRAVIVGEDRLNVAIARGNGIEPGVYLLRNNAAAVNRALKAFQAAAMGAGGKKGHWHADGTFHEEHD
ncbi:MAG: efflux RND transporter periplasmic adaptor subunit [Gemmataceae bacterium]|nr:efflux RND transporter periplasmic adaptor subunit [Gemmata sp.]MDW8198158.1 efflux RND transporter periplasmic adaptor subunit [Gemmataceae bacterium]